MSKINRRWIERVYTTADSLRLEDLAWDATYADSKARITTLLSTKADNTGSTSDSFSIGVGTTAKTISFGSISTLLAHPTSGFTFSDDVTAESFTTAGNITATGTGVFTGIGSGLTALNATQLTTGTVPTGRMTGQYLNITGVGTLTAGTWNAGTIAVGYGGTGKPSVAANKFLYSTAADTYGEVGVGNSIQVSVGVIDTIQDIRTNATPTFTNINLAGTLSVGDGGTGKGTFATNKILWTSALDTISELGIGTSLTTNAGTTLNTIQDIRISASPSFASLTLSTTPLGVASGGTGLNAASLTGNGTKVVAVNAGGTAYELVAVATAGHNHNLSQLSDVVLTTIADGHILEWDTGTSRWVNVPKPNTAVWGSITGTLSSQTDLINYIAAISGTTAATFTINTDGAADSFSALKIGNGALDSITMGFDPTNGTLSFTGTSLSDIDMSGTTVKATTFSGSASGLTSIPVAQLDGAVSVGKGGTGQTTFATTNGILLGSGTTAFTQVANLATGNVLVSNGTTSAPTFGKVTSAHVDSSIIRADGNNAFGAAQSMGGFRLTNLGTPTATTDAATKAYVDGVATGLDFKASVKVATTANITLSGTQTVDGIALVTNDRVLVKNQTTASLNGIYFVTAGAWTRSLDADENAEVTSGFYTYVEQGTVNGQSSFVLTTTGAITVGTTALTFAQFSGAGQIVAGAGLTKTNNTLDVVGGNGIAVAADSVALGALTANWDTSGDSFKIRVETPVASTDVANKAYVDNKVVTVNRAITSAELTARSITLTVSVASGFTSTLWPEGGPAQYGHDQGTPLIGSGDFTISGTTLSWTVGQSLDNMLAGERFTLIYTT